MSTMRSLLPVPSPALRSRPAASPSLPFRHTSPHPVSRPLLQEKPACACGGGCPRCQAHLPLQRKLKVGQPGDIYEQEADRVADEVMRTPEPAIQRKPT